jgi:protein required for attachment to host cells
MQALAIVVADAARARLFTFKREDERDPAPVLRERADLVSNERRLRDAELYTGGQSSSRTPGGHGFAVDDHRDGHAEETDRRFAQVVIEQLASLASETACPRVALVASPRFLGHLRAHAGALRGLAIEEVARDLTREPAPRLREHLGELGVLPSPR